MAARARRTGVDLNRGVRRMGRGSGIRAASATSIQIEFTYGGRCREYLKLDPTKATSIKYAEQLLARINHEITVGTFDYAAYFPHSRRARRLAKQPGNIVTVGELLTDWLKYVYPTVQPETYGDYAE